MIKNGASFFLVIGSVFNSTHVIKRNLPNSFPSFISESIYLQSKNYNGWEHCFWVHCLICQRTHWPLLLCCSRLIFQKWPNMYTNFQKLVFMFLLKNLPKMGADWHLTPLDLKFHQCRRSRALALKVNHRKGRKADKRKMPKFVNFCSVASIDIYALP